MCSLLANLRETSEKTCHISHSLLLIRLNENDFFPPIQFLILSLSIARCKFRIRSDNYIMTCIGHKFQLCAFHCLSVVYCCECPQLEWPHFVLKAIIWIVSMIFACFFRSLVKIRTEHSKLKHYEARSMKEFCFQRKKIIAVFLCNLATNKCFIVFYGILLIWLGLWRNIHCTLWSIKFDTCFELFMVDFCNFRTLLLWMTLFIEYFINISIELYLDTLNSPSNLS